jgi:hypothetical protein
VNLRHRSDPLLRGTQASIAAITPTIDAADPPELHARTARKMRQVEFIPHMPVSTVSGRKIVDMTVSTFITGSADATRSRG